MNREIRISVLETPRLALRPLGLDDAEQLTALLQDPVIAQWTSSIPFPYSIEDARSFISKRVIDDRTGESFVWGIVEKQSDVLMGTVGLHDVQPEESRAALGYWIGESFRGSGFTTEATRRVLSWAFEEVEFERIQATYLPGNEASARIMQNIGMLPEGLLRSYAIKYGELQDIHIRAVLRTDSTWLSTEQQWAAQ